MASGGVDQQAARGGHLLPSHTPQDSPSHLRGEAPPTEITVSEDSWMANGLGKEGECVLCVWGERGGSE